MRTMASTSSWLMYLDLHTRTSLDELRCESTADCMKTMFKSTADWKPAGFCKAGLQSTPLKMQKTAVKQLPSVTAMTHERRIICRQRAIVPRRQSSGSSQCSTIESRHAPFLAPTYNWAFPSTPAGRHIPGPAGVWEWAAFPAGLPASHCSATARPPRNAVAAAETPPHSRGRRQTGPVREHSSGEAVARRPAAGAHADGAGPGS
jgi:hypothetical protein